MSTEKQESDDKPVGSTDGLAACPCGKIPPSLCLMDAGQGGKWAMVNGGCCGEWNIEFRTQYAALDSDECKRLAREAWNSAPRAANAKLSGPKLLVGRKWRKRC